MPGNVEPPGFGWLKKDEKERRREWFWWFQSP